MNLSRLYSSRLYSSRSHFSRFLSRVFLAALATLSLPATAAPVSGAVSWVGTLCIGSSPGNPACTAQDVSTLSYFDFLHGGAGGLAPTPGAPGQLLFLTALGDLEPVMGRTGQINDFAIPGPAAPLASFSPVSPLWTVTGADGATYSYVLSALTAIHRSIPNALDVRGQGNLCRNGSDCNLFNFIFTTQNAEGAIRTTFSASQSGVATVPEPASLALLGLGLAGFAFGIARRRRD